MRRPRAAACRALIQREEASQGPAVSGGTGIKLWDRIRKIRAGGGERLEAKVWELGNLVGEEFDYGFGREDCSGRGGVGRGGLGGDFRGEERGEDVFGVGNGAMRDWMSVAGFFVVSIRVQVEDGRDGG